MFELPDWKDPGAYPQPGKASNARFAWEFLRRNVGYQATWADYISTLRESAGRDVEALRLIDYLDADMPTRAAMLAEHYPTPERWNAAVWRLHELPCWDRRTVRDDGRVYIVPLDRALAEPWGLQRLLSPREPWNLNTVSAWLPLWGAVFCPTSVGLRELEQETQGGPVHFMQKSRWLAVAVDLERPIEVIEAEVLRLIRAEREARIAAGHIKPLSARARAPRLLVEYLRILDARARGVVYSRIAEVLYPDEWNAPPEYPLDRRLRAAFKEACRLRDGGYRVLPLLADKTDRRRKK